MTHAPNSLNPTLQGPHERARLMDDEDQKIVGTLFNMTLLQALRAVRDDTEESMDEVRSLADSLEERAIAVKLEDGENFVLDTTGLFLIFAHQLTGFFSTLTPEDPVEFYEKNMFK